MSALKKLTKISALATMFCGATAAAQILDMSVDLSELRLPDGFLDSLQACEPYKNEKSAEYENVKVRTEYEILGKEDGKCRLKIEGFTNSAVHITQDCELSLEQAQVYAEALRQYQRKHFSPRFDKLRIESNTDYQQALKIMSNPRLCRFIRDEIDHTADIREKLATCEPIVSVEEVLDAKITREIKGVEDSKCAYSFKLWQPPADTAGIGQDILNKAEILSDINYHYECLWTEAQTMTYINILEALVLPEEEGYNFKAAMRPNPWEEMNFITHNCRYIAGGK